MARQPRKPQSQDSGCHGSNNTGSMNITSAGEVDETLSARRSVEFSTDVSVLTLPSPPPAKRLKIKDEFAPLRGRRVPAKWSDEAVACLFRLRFATLAPRFDNVKNNQMRREAYELLATELSVEVEQQFSAEQVQNKLHELKKKWFNPKVKATGNGATVRSPPAYFDIMFEYWGAKLGYSRSSLLTSDPDPDGDGDKLMHSIDVSDKSLSEESDDSDVAEVAPRSNAEASSAPGKAVAVEKKLFSAKQKSKATKGQPSHAVALLQGLQAVGTGLERIGSSFGTAPDSGEASSKILSALQRQTEALEKQSDQIGQLLQYILRREADGNTPK